MAFRLNTNKDYESSGLCQHEKTYYDDVDPKSKTLVCISCGLKFASLAEWEDAKDKVSAVNKLLDIIGEPIRSIVLRVIRIKDKKEKEQCYSKEGPFALLVL